MDEKRFSYLFSTSEPLLSQNAIGRISVPKAPLQKDDIVIENDDTDLLSHSDMSWETMEDRYMLFEIASNDSISTTSKSSSNSNLSFSLLDQISLSIDQKIIQCATENNWSSYALDISLWDDGRAPVMKLRNLKETSFDDIEFCGYLTDRLIGVGKSFLTKSPENSLYILSKCIMRNMSLSNITMLSYHRYLQYIDLAYNYITNLSPLGGVPYLMYLNVAHNRMNTILNFSPPWYLTYVNLSYNYISKMYDISDFWSIVHLDLSHNAIETITGLQNLKYLKYLNLSYNLIEYIENLDRLNIQELNLEGNCILSYKSAIPGYGISTLSDLRKLYLGYNKLSTLEFFKDAYSLRVIDLKFNRINDLLELLNLTGLIQEVDFRGNSCTKWPNYKAVLLFSIPSIQIIDGVNVSTSEKIAAVALFAPPVNLTAARTITKLTLLEQLNIPKIDLHVTPYDEVSPPIIILTGPSAVRKLSLALHATQTLSKKVQYCQWYTTKSSEDESENQFYIFVDREEFNDMSRHGEFLAIQERLGYSYGFHHNQITSLKLRNKIGITQTDLHATIQMLNRYSNSRAVLVLPKNEEIHREWIQERFYVYTCTKDSKENLLSEESSAIPIGSDINFIKEILNDIIRDLKLLPKIPLATETDDKTTHNTLGNVTIFDDEAVQGTTEMKDKTSNYIKFQEQDTNSHFDDKGLRVLSLSSTREIENLNTVLFIKTGLDIGDFLRIPDIFRKSDTFANSTQSDVFLFHSNYRVILDEHSNVIVEDEQLRRKRHQAKLLQRRNTLIRGIVPLFTDELSESSEELLTRRSPEMEKPEDMKDFYTDLILKSRKMYLDQHVNKPGFFSLVLLSDDYFKAFNKLINFIYELYTNYSFQEPKFLAELNHFSKIAIPAMVDPIIDEIKQSLSTPILQRRTLLRMYGVTSWKDLMPSQIVEDLTDVAD
ncbi:leucine-rich repeat and guanylate kinase domain-containing protein-like [Bombus impatiens]|uniref:Leucine-rich repeat and guanylate kinase domain-containing protein-like n=1 Tax=Bombus impatiens TaxID=132113 RepID=A0A6P8M304_BOMIM|nr:leucine-rich repeat and guanylate kinase domain-containing protein-like [Bombus impatiens]